MIDVTLPGINVAWFTQDGGRCAVNASSVRVSAAYQVAQFMQTPFCVLNESLDSEKPVAWGLKWCKPSPISEGAPPVGERRLNPGLQLHCVQVL